VIVLEKLNQNPSFSNADVALKFKTLLEQFAETLNREGAMRVKPYDPKAPLARFNQLPESTQWSIYNNFVRYYDVCSQGNREKISIRQDGCKLLWKMIAMLGYVPAHDLMDKITDEDIIEIYNLDFVQIYRNMKFIELCSYPLDTVFTHEFPELYRRPDVITAQLIEFAQRTLLGQIHSTVPFQVEDHFLEEIFSEEKSKFQITMGIISPLYTRDHKIAGWINTLRARPVSN
jgi:hypothetical protein